MRSGASCGQAGDPAGNTSTSCGPLATGQRRVWDLSSPGWARPRWPAIVCGGDSRSCGARSCSIPSRWLTCSSGPARRATSRRLRSCGPACWHGPTPWPSRDRQVAAVLSNDNDVPALQRSPRAHARGSAVAGRQHPLGPDPRISSLDLAGPAAGVSLHPDLFCLRPGGARAPRGAARQLVGPTSNRPVPSMASGWRRPGSLTR